MPVLFPARTTPDVQLERASFRYRLWSPRTALLELMLERRAPRGGAPDRAPSSVGTVFPLAAAPVAPHHLGEGPARGSTVEGEPRPDRRKGARLGERPRGSAPAGGPGERPTDLPIDPAERVEELEGVRVLVVDADDSSRRRIAAELAQLGCELEEAADGTEALAKMSAFPPDLVLLDADLPRFSGMDVLACMRADTELARVPVCLRTADAPDDALRAAALGHGVWHVLSKALPRSELVDWLRAMRRTRARLDGLATEREDLARVDPESVELPVGRVSSRALPARRVHGDVTAVVTLRAGAWVAMLIDVAGSGPSRAINAAALRATVEESLREHASPLFALVEAHARHSEALLAARQHASITLVYVDEARELLEVSNAGGSSVLLAMRDGSTVDVAAPSPPLGSARPFSVGPARFSLQDVTRLALVSEALGRELGAHDDPHAALTLLCDGDPSAATAPPNLTRASFTRLTSNGTRERAVLSLLWIDFTRRAGSG